MNSRDVYAEEEAEKSVLMDPKLWEYIGESAADDIMGGGWIDSYTGEHFSREVVEEFAENLFQKIAPIIDKSSRILEIGCASGMSMYRIAPLVGLYYGTDISRVIIEKNRKRVEEEGHTNIKLGCMAAHEIDEIEEGDFDLVIVNSVIQDFHGHNYLRKVIRKAVDKLGQTGYLFIGDIMDLDSKQALIDDLTAFKRNNRDKNYKTKTVWDAEQFFSRAFFEDLTVEIPAVQKVECSDKIFTIANELTRFRFDTLIHVDKGADTAGKSTVKNKYQHDLRDMEKHGPPRPVMLTEPHDPAYVIYTSGSTGMPKGAVVEHIGMMNHIWAKVREFGITRGSIVAQNSPLSFDISVWQLFAALAVGGKTVIYPNEAVLETGRFAAHLVEDRVTVLEVVPSYLTLLLDAFDINPAVLEALEYLLVTGEAVSPALLKRWFEMYPDVKVANAYGPTEVSDDITHYVMDRPPQLPRVPIGKPIRNLRIYIVDDDMNLCPVGVKGEIWVSGVGVGRGYLGDEEKTRRAFMEDPFRHGTHALFGERDTRLYKTGDLGVWLPDGNIDFFGRKDQQVKIRGFRIELGEIENKLTALPEVKEAVVVDIGNEDDRRYLCAYIVPDPSEVSPGFDVNELRDYLLGQLPDYMVPQFFVKLEQLPLTPNGKVDRKNLPAHDIKYNENYTAPSGEIEETLAVIVSEVLGINRETIGANDDFFDLGANSVSILNLQHRITKAFNYDISISLLFLYPTIRGVAKNIHEEEFLNKLECVIKLNQGRNEKNIFMLHPMHGMVYQYKDVAGLLKEHYNIYGVQIRGFLTESKFPESIDEMASDYLRQIKTIQKEGPYLIAGYCLGCVVGYEMIYRLEAAGEVVDRFIVLDEPAFIEGDKIESLVQKGEGIVYNPEADDGSAADPQFTPEIAREKRKIENTILNLEKIPDELFDRLQNKRNVIESHLRKIEQKVSGVIKADMCVIKARENDRPGFELDLYKKLTHGKVSLDVTEGNHDSMFYPPNVTRLAELIVKNI
jgi:amino acid adenylation domain-containing protein